MRDILEERDKWIAKNYGKPTHAQLAQAASRIEASCRAFVECANTIHRDGTLNIPNSLRFEAAYKALDPAAAKIRAWLAESGYGNHIHIDAEQSISTIERVIQGLDKAIACLRDEPTFPRLVDATTLLRKLCRAYYDCAGAVVRRREVIHSFPQFEKAYKMLFEVSEEIWIWVQKCHQHP